MNPSSSTIMNDNIPTIVSSRPDRELSKQVLTPGDYNLVPYEDSRCQLYLSEVQCSSGGVPSTIDYESRVFSNNFDGYVLIGDSDCFIDRDFELILQQMCCGETSRARFVYKDSNNQVAKEISCLIHLKNVTEEQLISDWGWMRLYEASIHHKERGVELFKEKRVTDAFRRFNKSLKMLVAVEPLEEGAVEEEMVKEMIDLKVKLYNNLAHCQLHYQEFDAALQLCNKAILYDPGNVKSLYRRCIAYTGLNLYEEAWNDIQDVLKADPNDKLAQMKASLLRPKIEEIKKKYSNVIKKMFE